MIVSNKKYWMLRAALVLCSSIIVSGCDQFGELPSGEEQQRIEKSKNYNLDSAQFVNRRPNILDKMGEGHSFWSDPLKRMSHNFFFNSNEPNQTSNTRSFDFSKGMINSSVNILQYSKKRIIKTNIAKE